MQKSIELTNTIAEKVRNNNEDANNSEWMKRMKRIDKLMATIINVVNWLSHTLTMWQCQFTAHWGQITNAVHSNRPLQSVWLCLFLLENQAIEHIDRSKCRASNTHYAEKIYDWHIQCKLMIKYTHHLEWISANTQDGTFRLAWYFSSLPSSWLP